MSSPLLVAENLHIRLKTERGLLHAVRGISLRLHEGESLCLVGESGCGKSLTSLALMGLLPKNAEVSADRLLFDGEDMLANGGALLNRLRGSQIAMIFQDPMTSLNPTLTIGRQLCEGARARGVDAKQARSKAIAMLERVGLAQPEQRLQQYPHQLSGGQRQRIMIAMALMAQPRLLIADEPTTALDVTIQAQILHLIQELDKELGLSLLLITHDLGVVAGIADRVAVMYAGRIVEQQPVGALFQAPAHPYTKGLMGAVPVPGLTPRGADLTSIAGRVPELIGGIEGCAFAPRCKVALPQCGEWIPRATPLPEGVAECLRIEQGLAT